METRDRERTEDGPVVVVEKERYIHTYIHTVLWRDAKGSRGEGRRTEDN